MEIFMNIFKNISKTTLFGLMVVAGTPFLQGLPALDPELITADSDNQNPLALQKLALLKQLCIKQNKMRDILVPFFLQSSTEMQEQLASTIVKIVFNEFYFVTHCHFAPVFIDSICCSMSNLNLGLVLNSPEVSVLEDVPQFTETKTAIVALLNELNNLPKLITLHVQFPVFSQQMDSTISFIYKFGQKMQTKLADQAPALAEKFEQLGNEIDELFLAGEIDTSI
jgi:hypothetical protein